jgi:hypothetical protein
MATFGDATIEPYTFNLIANEKRAERDHLDRRRRDGDGLNGERRPNPAGDAARSDSEGALLVGGIGDIGAA